MKSQSRVLLGGVGIFLFACAGKNLTEVGELNHAGAGGGDGAAQAGSDDGGTAPGAGTSNGGTSNGGTSNGGTSNGGTAGVPDPPYVPDGGTAGAGGENDGPPDVGNGTVFQEGLSRVTAVTADATAVYWVEHGTEDSLGNYQNDGRLVARDFDDEGVRVIVDSLPGAVGVALTSEHAYVSVDQLYDSGLRNALVRVPLAGGAPETVLIKSDEYWPYNFLCAGCFVHHGDTGYFPLADKLYRITPEASAPEVFSNIVAYELTAGVDSLYVQSDDGIWVIPYDTGEPGLVTTELRYEIQVSGDYLYGIEDGTSSLYLSRMPLAGGAWVRLPPRRVAAYSWRMQILDGLFFHDIHRESGWQLKQGNLSDPEGAGTALDLREADSHRIWVGTHHGVFWNDGSRVMHVPLAVE